MPTPLQIRTLQVARRKLNLAEPQYRMLLRNVAGVESCKDLSQSEFEDVMAVLEDSGVRLSDNHPDDYWREKVRLRGTSSGSRMTHKIHELVAKQDRYPLAALCRRHSDDRTDQVEQLRPREAWKLIEMLKAVIEREAPVPDGGGQADLPF